MAKKKRKVKKGRLLILITIAVCLIALLVFSVSTLIKIIKTPKSTFDSSSLNINELDYSNMQEFDLDLYSNQYMLVRLNDFKVLYGKDLDTKFYPASLTKVMTLNAALSTTDNYQETSTLSYDQYWTLINDDASVAGIYPGKEQTLNDLFYELILPSGADAAEALNNYSLNSTGKDLVTIMNEKVKELNLSNSSFSNTTGLDDQNLYTSLNDYFKIVLDTIKNDTGKKVLKTLKYPFNNHLPDVDDTLTHTIIKYIDLSNRSDGVNILGGKTGYTPKAGQNVVVLYTYNNRSYMLILAGASGASSEHTNIKDAQTILNYLYN